jgi:hypothetical protein
VTSPLADAHQAALAERYGPPVRSPAHQPTTAAQAAMRRLALAAMDDNEAPPGGGHEGGSQDGP